MMMAASQLLSGKFSTAFASTRRRWVMTNKEAGSYSMGQSRGCSSFLWEKFSHDAVICSRKPFQNVTHSLVDSDCNSEPCEVEEEPRDLLEDTAEEGTLEKDDSINGLSESVLQPPNQLPPQNVKRELIMLSLPAVASQAIDPLAQLMETAYIGILGPVQLASAGVSMSIFNIISKLFNMPLLSVATSFVAEDIAKSSSDGDKGFKRKQLSSVSTALSLAVGIGIFEALALIFGTGSFLSLMGVSPDSPMREPAQRFLSLRALGAPAVVLSLALQGVLRGFKDTKTPMGVTGAATATVVSQYIGSFLMLWQLSKRAVFLLGRTLAVLITMTIGTSMAARQGPLSMAAHQICLQVWLAVSLLTDALAASGQALVASSLSSGDYKTVKELTNFLLKVGIVTGTTLALILGPSFGSLANFFTKDSAVLQIVKSGTWFVSASQPLNALAFIFDGLHYGASDFPYAAYSMMLVGVISSSVLLYASSVIGLLVYG
ncbi:Protein DETOXIFICATION 45 chloroplastic [Bienertia sinuspersici]